MALVAGAEPKEDRRAKFQADFGVPVYAGKAPTRTAKTQRRRRKAVNRENRERTRKREEEEPGRIIGAE
jgi:hypothetical protein